MTDDNPARDETNRDSDPSLGNALITQAKSVPDSETADLQKQASINDVPVLQPEYRPHPLDAGPAAPALQPRLDLVGKIADPRLRNRVEANVRLGTQRQVAAFTDQQRDLKAQAKAIIDQGGDLDSIPAKLMLGIDLPGRDALHAYAMTHANPTTDPATYYGLKNAALDDPASFQGIDLGNHMAQLNAKDYGDLQQLQSDLRNGQPPADFPLQQAYKANTDRLLGQLGLLMDSTLGSSAADNDNTDGKQQSALIRRAIDQHVAATEIASGRKMTPNDHSALLQQIANSLPSSGARTPQSEFQIASSDASDTPIDPRDIPESDNKAARREDILRGGGGDFQIEDNPNADGEKPLREIPLFSTVLDYKSEIEKASKETGVDADLIRAIMYMETTHGYYDSLTSLPRKLAPAFLPLPAFLTDMPEKLIERLESKSILPMNLNVKYWGNRFGTREQLEDPYLNILAGAEMLASIQNNLPHDASIEKIATLYNQHSAREVTDYGARVAKIYKERLWENQKFLIRGRGYIPKRSWPTE